MAYIRIMSGESKGTRVEIDRDEVIFGRAPDNLIVLKDASISGKHCAIIRQGRQFLLRDLGSTNGTMLNGVAITEHQLSPKDEISVGHIAVTFDGEDVDPYEPAGQSSTEPTMKMPATGARGQIPQAFNARSKGKRAAGLTLWIIGGVLILIAMGAFLYSLFGK